MPSYFSILIWYYIPTLSLIGPCNPHLFAYAFLAYETGWESRRHLNRAVHHFHREYNGSFKNKQRTSVDKWIDECLVLPTFLACDCRWDRPPTPLPIWWLSNRRADQCDLLPSDLLAHCARWQGVSARQTSGLKPTGLTITPTLLLLFCFVHRAGVPNCFNNYKMSLIFCLNETFVHCSDCALCYSHYNMEKWGIIVLFTLSFYAFVFYVSVSAKIYSNLTFVNHPSLPTVIQFII